MPKFDVPAAGPGFGLGFAIVRNQELNDTPRANGSYEWVGVYGSKVFVDPRNELSVVILTNLHGLIGAFPNQVTHGIYKALQQRLSQEFASANEFHFLGQRDQDMDRVGSSLRSSPTFTRKSPTFEDDQIHPTSHIQLTQ